MLIYVVLWLVMGAVCSLIAWRRGESSVFWFVAGFIFWPAALVAIAWPSRRGKPCPDCAKRAPSQALICPYCRHQFPEQTTHLPRGVPQWPGREKQAEAQCPTCGGRSVFDDTGTCMICLNPNPELRYWWGLDPGLPDEAAPLSS